MTARLDRTPPFVLCGLLVLAGVVAGAGAAAFVHRLDPFEAFMLGMAAFVAVVTCVVLLEPAWILTAGMLLSVFSGNWGNMGIPVPLDRVAMACGIGSVLVRSLLRADTPRIQLRRVHWLMGLLLLYAVASAAWSHTLTQHDPLFALLDRLGVVPFALYLAAPSAFATERQRRILGGGLALLGAYLGLITLFEAVGAKSLVIPHYIENPLLGIHAERGRGPFLEAGANGLAMFQCLTAAALTLGWWRDWRLRTAAVAIIILCVAGMLYTVTRQVWAGAAAGTAAAMLADRRLRVWLPCTCVAALVVVLVSLAVVPGLAANLRSRTNDQSSIWDRLNSDGAALRMIEARPALGFGWGTFGTASAAYYRLAKTYPLSTVSDVHNVPLSNAAELGLLGAALWLAILIEALAVPAVRRARPELEPWRLALIAVAVAWFVQSNFTPFDYAFDNYVVWLFAGLVAAAPAQRTAAAVRQRRRPPDPAPLPDPVEA